MRTLLRIAGLTALALISTITTSSAADNAKSLRPLVWFYDSDGTDLRLSTTAEDRSDRTRLLRINFQCSRKELRVEVWGLDFSEKRLPADFDGTVSITVDGDSIRVKEWKGQTIIENTSTLWEVDKDFVRSVFKVTANLYHDSGDVISLGIYDKTNKMNYMLGYKLQKDDSEAGRKARSSIAAFRGQCANWWSSYLY